MCFSEAIRVLSSRIESYLYWIRYLSAIHFLFLNYWMWSIAFLTCLPYNELSVQSVSVFRKQKCLVAWFFVCVAFLNSCLWNKNWNQFIVYRLLVFELRLTTWSPAVIGQIQGDTEFDIHFQLRVVEYTRPLEGTTLPVTFQWWK